ncbi:high mobility group B protein 14 isoform X1 [Benincasa hispida]|uniref:high mobility group B protein 14 isoform X1 n=1 Tax=Benincasa hispida TaxID=102211 RepID=UPI001901A1C5|nr:high mobility group B protein 14 isoform X1 [Benincasa hispida]
MAKAKKPQKSPSASAHDSSEAFEEASPEDTGLCVKRSEEMKRAAKASRFNTDNKRTKTIKKPKSKQKKKNDKFDVNKPKKPPTAFFYFLDDFRKEFQEQNPDVKTMRDVGKACGEKWKTMTYEEKVQYYDIATQKRAEFDKAMAEYKKRKESGLDQESEEDWEIDE